MNKRGFVFATLPIHKHLRDFIARPHEPSPIASYPVIANNTFLGKAFMFSFPQNW